MCPNCFPLHSELRSSRSPRFLPLMRTGSYPCSAPSEPWEYTLSIPPLLGGWNLSVSFGKRARGHPVTKQRLFRCIVDAVSLAYSSLGLQCPIGVRAHSTRGITSLWAWSSSVSITEICVSAGWASTHLLGFITWTYRPYRPGSSLLNGTFYAWELSDGETLPARRSSSLICYLYVSAQGVEMQEVLERLSRPDVTSLSLAHFSIEVIVMLPLSIECCSSISTAWLNCVPIASLDKTQFEMEYRQGYCCNIGSLRSGMSTAYLPC